MKWIAPAVLSPTVLRLLAAGLLGGAMPAQAAEAAPAGAPQWRIFEDYCVECHNFEDFAGGLALDTLRLDAFHSEAETWEKVLRKLRTGLMPPAGEARPPRAELDQVAGWLEGGLDQGGVRNPGAEGLRRLNRVEYANAVRDLLAFEPGAIVMSALPEDAVVEGFDNNAEALTISPTLLEAYVAAAMEISRQAVGDAGIAATDVHYYRNGRGSQLAHLDGQPLGTRGGMTVKHNFPLDAEYVFRVRADIQESGWKNDEGRMWWCDGPAVEVTFNGVHVPVEDYRSFRLRVPAGPQQISAFLVDRRRCAGVVELYQGEALASVGGAVEEIEIQGPFNPAGVRETPSRERIFVCRPGNAGEESACAREILSTLATRAFRRPVEPDSADVDDLMSLYELARGEEGGDFELGIQYALSRLLIDPQFLYRFEAEPEGLAPGEVYAVSDLELATRLSFFLWSSIPDDTLLELAVAGRLSEPQVLAAQVGRMLTDPRSQALIDNFAGQWLKLRDLDDAAPQDAGFDEELRQAMRRETELLFESLLRGQRSMLELLDADYTYVNERLAGHYGIDGVQGSYMRRVALPPGSPRRGLLGHASILTATSNPNRTSPVVRGVWVVESLLGAPVPQPPPGVETNLEGGADASGAPLPDTLRERLEQHREDPNCAGCHGIMDPVGLALENFDLVGRWRDTDNGAPIDAASRMVDGTSIDGPAALRRALLSRSDAFLTALTEKLLSYALGRQVEYYDGPAVRAIVRAAAEDNYSFTALVQGVVASDPFQKRIVEGEAGGEVASSR